MNRKPLCFRNQRYGGTVAQRDHVQYTVHYSRWLNGKEVNPYYVSRWDVKNKDHVSTETVKRFPTEDAAKQFCQDLYDGKVDLSALKAEIDAKREAKEAAERAAIQADVDRFKDHLAAAGASLPVFMDALKVWGGLMEDAHRAIYNETKEENANV